MVLFATIFVLAWRFPNRRALHATLVVAAAMHALTRDAEAYVVLMCGFALAIRALVRLRRREHWVTTALLGAAFIGIFVATDASANHGRRWVYPLTNVVVMRTLDDQEMLESFVSKGMPHPDALRPGRPRRAYERDPALDDFKRWLSSEGKSVYVAYLLGHPLYLMAPPLENAPGLLGGDVSRYGARVPRALRMLGVPWARPLWPVHASIVVAALALAVLR